MGHLGPYLEVIMGYVPKDISLPASLSLVTLSLTVFDILLCIFVTLDKSVTDALCTCDVVQHNLVQRDPFRIRYNIVEFYLFVICMFYKLVD